eukprot:4101861-Amphidinium_carterae.1
MPIALTHHNVERSLAKGHGFKEKRKGVSASQAPLAANRCRDGAVIATALATPRSKLPCSAHTPTMLQSLSLRTEQLFNAA